MNLQELLQTLGSLENIATILAVTSALVVALNKLRRKIFKKPSPVNLEKPTTQKDLKILLKKLLNFILITIPIAILILVINYTSSPESMAATILEARNISDIKHVTGDLESYIPYNQSEDHDYLEATYIYSVDNKKYTVKSKVDSDYFTTGSTVKKQHPIVYYVNEYPELSVAENSVEMLSLPVQIFTTCVFFVFIYFIMYATIAATFEDTKPTKSPKNKPKFQPINVPESIESQPQEVIKEHENICNG